MAATSLFDFDAVSIDGKPADFSAQRGKVFLIGGRFTEFRGERIASPHTHGTGCTFAAAIAAQLALGRTLAQAIPLVQQYIAGAIRHAPGLGQGHGPMHHFWAGRAGEAASLY